MNIISSAFSVIINNPAATTSIAVCAVQQERLDWYLKIF